MSLYFEATASGLAECFRNNESQNSTLRIGWDEWDSMDDWTASDCRAVLEAAKHNTSIETLDVKFIRWMSEKAVEVFSVVVAQLDRLKHVRVLECPYAAAIHVTAPSDPGVADKLLQAITKCRSDVRSFESRACYGPRAFLRFTERFPNLESIALDCRLCQRCPGRGCRACSGFHEFAVTFAAAVGRLASLRSVCFKQTRAHPCLPQLLSSLRTSATVQEVAVDIPPAGANDAVVRNACLLCVCTKTVKIVKCRGEESSRAFAGMSSFFDIGPLPSFSPTITEMQFSRCAFDSEEPVSLVNRAARAMQNVEFLRFGRCHFPFAMKMLEKMPRLKKFSCVSRSGVIDVLPYEPMDLLGEYDSVPYVLQRNADIADICRAVERQNSLLDDIELDVISLGNHGESFPSIARLMGACRGTLVLNFGELPWRSATHIVNGAARIRRELKELRLRFANCDFDETSVADIFRTCGSNSSLAVLEIGFDAYLELDTSELSLAAIRDLVASNDTLQTLSIRGLTTDGASDVLEQVLPVLATTNRSLRTLELSGRNDLDDCWPGARGPMLDMLRENRVFSTLEGVRIPIGDPAQHLLSQNLYGRRLLQANDPSPMGIWAPVLAKVSEDKAHEVMYTFLRAKPGLVRSRDLLPPRGRTRARKRGRGVR